MEEQTPDPGKQGIPEIFVQRRHRVLFNTTTKPITHHEISAFPQLLKETRNVTEVVAVVCVGHDDVLTGRSADAPPERTAVSSFLNMYDFGSEPLCNHDRTVGASVVCDNDLACKVLFL